MLVNSLISIMVLSLVICWVYSGFCVRSSNAPCGMRSPPWVSGFWRSSRMMSMSVFMVLFSVFGLFIGCFR